MQRLGERYGRPDETARDEAVEVLLMLTSFASFDTLAGTTRTPADVIPIVQRLALASLEFHAPAVRPPTTTTVADRTSPWH